MILPVQAGRHVVGDGDRRVRGAVPARATLLRKGPHTVQGNIPRQFLLTSQRRSLCGLPATKGIGSVHPVLRAGHTLRNRSNGILLIGFQGLICRCSIAFRCIAAHFINNVIHQTMRCFQSQRSRLYNRFLGCLLRHSLCNRNFFLLFCCRRNILLNIAIVFVVGVPTATILVIVPAIDWMIALSQSTGNSSRYGQRSCCSTENISGVVGCAIVDQRTAGNGCLGLLEIKQIQSAANTSTIAFNRTIRNCCSTQVIG